MSHASRRAVYHAIDRPRRRLVTALLALPPLALAGRRVRGATRYELEIRKSERLLRVLRGGDVVRTFRVAVGRGGRGPKRRSGDRRTPVGTYRVVALRPSERFHFFMQLDYPNIEDAFDGLRRGLITREQFDAILSARRAHRLPPQGTPLGGAIGIHGLGTENARKLRIHRSLDWTEGCVALTNHELDELRRYVDLGTRVVIRE